MINDGSFLDPKKGDFSTKTPGTHVGPADPMSAGPILFPYFKGFWIGSSIGMGPPHVLGGVPGISPESYFSFQFSWGTPNRESPANLNLNAACCKHLCTSYIFVCTMSCPKTYSSATKLNAANATT